MFKEELLIIRHGRTTTNIRKTEDLDAPLTDFGIHQAKTVGKFLAKHMDLTGFRFYSSPFLRCVHTAVNIVSFVGAGPIQIDDRFREYLNHSGKSVHVPSREKHFPKMMWGSFPLEGQTYTEEQNEQLINRVEDGFWNLAPKSVVITHGLPGLLLAHLATSRQRVVPIWDHSIDNCSMTYIVRGSVMWWGRNLYYECDHDPFDTPRSYDAADLIKK